MIDVGSPTTVVIICDRPHPIVTIIHREISMIYHIKFIECTTSIIIKDVNVEMSEEITKHRGDKMSWGYINMVQINNSSSLVD
ncbi:hypothetical protein FACS1894195_5680 [Bacteroidia bacterium]|nr:hypothetical protein FACS1894195_5680 [Bacteroidia bacterium]